MSRTYRLLPPVMLLITGLSLPPAAPAQDAEQSAPAVYRVEVIVFTRDRGQSDDHLADAPEAFAAAIDPAWEAVTRETGTALGRLPPPLEELDSAGEPDRPRPPPAFVALEDTSSAMGDAWRRLADSPSHTPLARLAWYQAAPRNAATPWVRLHGRETLDYNPLAPAKPATDRPGNAAALQPDTDAALRAVPVEENTGDATPLSDPAFYRLDGRVHFYRRQYDHVAVDLVWQTPIMRMQAFAFNAPLEPTAWSVHRLRAGRTVRPGRLEYFDSPWLGALVRYTRWQPPESGGDGGDTADPVPTTAP